MKNQTKGSQEQESQLVQKLALSAMALGLMFSVACTKSAQVEKGTSSLEQSSDAIVNGSKVRGGDPVARSTVALYIERSKQADPNVVEKPETNGARKPRLVEDVQHFCTGTLIAPRLVITAAHCIADFAEMLGGTPEQVVAKSYVGFGVPTAKSSQDRRVRLVRIESFVVHPEYVVNSVGSAMEKPMKDVALLKLAEFAPKGAVPAKLVVDQKVLTKGLELTLAGYGLVDGERQIDADQLMKTTVNVEEPNMTPVQFGYLFGAKKTGACSGDSGGPAYLKTLNQDGSLSVIGVTSWGDRTCQEIGAYTSIPALAPWIMQAIRAL